MFEVLNAESKPEHVGFRKVMHRLFQIYREEGFEANGMVPPQQITLNSFTEMSTTQI